MTTTALLLVRHGQSAWNAEGRWQGWADAPLSELGEQQALDAVEHLRDAGLTAAVSSDLQRARRTAEIIAAGLGLDHVEVEADLRERDVGLFSGYTGAELKLRHPECFDAEGRVLDIPEAEDLEVLLERVVRGLLRVARRHPEERVLVATHGGVIRALERHLGDPPAGGTPNLGGRWFDVCDGGRIDLGVRMLPVQPRLATRPLAD